MSATAIWLIVLFIPVMIWLRYSDNNNYANDLRTAGEKYNGTVAGEGLFGQLSLNIPYKGSLLVITPTRYRRGPDIYSAVLALSESHFPEITFGTNSVLQKSIGASDSDRVLTGDERFDFLFIVRSRHPAAAMKILTGAVREKLMNNPFYTPAFTFEPARFGMSTILKNYDQRSEAYAVLIETVISILDKAWS